MRTLFAAITLTGFATILSAPPASAQMAMDRPSAAAPFGAPINDSPIFYHLLFDQLEGRFGRGSSFRWEGEGWAGTDMDRIVLRTEGTVTNGVMEDGDQELLYSRPVSTYFNVQGGLRYDLDSAPGRGWAAFGIEGLAPLFFHVSATGYVSDQGHLAGKLDGNYDLLLTQTLILQPQIEMNFYSKDDPMRMIGAGLADLDTGLRLRYEISRKFAPYIGVAYENKFGGTARLAQLAGDHPSNLRLSAGVRVWF
jgi:copper resistance protein B